jgi:acyl-CoA thioester hydrolase
LPRVHINLPEQFSFTAKIRIRIGDINRAGHLSHVNLVAILEEARAQFMVERGFENEVSIAQHQTGFVLGDLAVVYKKQGFYGQTLEVSIAAMDFQEKSFDLVYQVRESTGSQELARAKTAILVYDYQSQKVIPVPPELIKKLTSG